MWKRLRHKEKSQISCWNHSRSWLRKYRPPDMDQWADWVIPSWPGWLTSHSPCLPLNTYYPDQTHPGQINALATANEGNPCKHTGQLYQHITTELEQYRCWYVNTNIWSVELRKAVIGVSASSSTKYSQSPPSQIMAQSIQNLCSKLGRGRGISERWRFPRQVALWEVQVWELFHPNPGAKNQFAWVSSWKPGSISVCIHISVRDLSEWLNSSFVPCYLCYLCSCFLHVSYKLPSMDT